ncbi:unnamed protein product [Parajaminaea phylloscopi]
MSEDPPFVSLFRDNVFGALDHEVPRSEYRGPSTETASSALDRPLLDQEHASNHAGRPCPPLTRAVRIQRAGDPSRPPASNSIDSGGADGASVTGDSLGASLNMERRNSELARPPASEDVWPFQSSFIDFDLAPIAPPAPLTGRPTTMGALPAQISAKAAALLGIAQPLLAQDTAGGHPYSTRDLSIAREIRRTPSTSTPSSRDTLESYATTGRRSLDSLQSSRSSSAGHSSSNHSALTRCVSISGGQDRRGGLAATHADAVREQRRRRVEKMTRWLGSVVPAHLAAPDAQNRQPAYLLDEQPSSFFASPRASSRQDIERTVPESLRNMIPTKKTKRHSSFIPALNNRHRADQRGLTAFEDPLDLASLTAQEHSEMVRRNIKLNSLLGEGAGAAARRLSAASAVVSHSQSRRRPLTTSHVPESWHIGQEDSPTWTRRHLNSVDHGSNEQKPAYEDHGFDSDIEILDASDFSSRQDGSQEYDPVPIRFRNDSDGEVWGSTSDSGSTASCSTPSTMSIHDHIDLHAQSGRPRHSIYAGNTVGDDDKNGTLDPSKSSLHPGTCRSVTSRPFPLLQKSSIDDSDDFDGSAFSYASDPAERRHRHESDQVLHRRRTAQARKLERFFGCSIDSSDLVARVKRTSVV